MVGDGKRLPVKAIGTVSLPVLVKDKVKYLILTNAYYVPEIVINLISVSSLTNQNYTTEFTGKTCVIKHKSYRKRLILAHATLKGGLYHINWLTKNISCRKSGSHSDQINKNKDCNVFSVTNDTWHRRLSHANEKYLQDIAKKNCVHGYNYNVNKSLDFCGDCVQSRCKKLPFDKHSTRVKNCLELVHTDVCYIGKSSIGGAKYFVLFIDDASSLIWGFPIKHKSDVFEIFVKWHNLMKLNYPNYQVRRIRSDNGKEYMNKNFEEYFNKTGIIHENSCPYTPQQNGRAEVQNRILLNSVRCMLSQSGLDPCFWAEAFMTSIYIKNRLITKASPDKTPYEIFFGKRPNYSRLRVFGCYAYYYDSSMSMSKNKLKHRGIKGIFVGYQNGGYRIFDPSKGDVIISRHVIFNEDKNCKSDRNEISRFSEFEIGHEQESILSDDKSIKSEETDLETDEFKEELDDYKDSKITKEDSDSEKEDIEMPKLSPRELADIKQRFKDVKKDYKTRFGRTSRPPSKFGEWTNNISEIASNLLHKKKKQEDNHDTEPSTYKQAIESEDSKEWKMAMKKEMKAMENNTVWELVTPPKNADIVGCRWIYKRKSNCQYKARLVAQGFSQKFGSNYDEVYSPVVKFQSVRTLLALSANQNYKVHHLDFDTAFLNGTLTETVYMRQPKGFEDPDYPNKVCRLKKSLYGLKQSPLVWNETISKFLKEQGFVQSVNDSCIYTFVDNGHIVLLALYVDDIILCSNSENLLEQVKLILSNKYKLKDLGQLKNFLGIQIEQTKKGIQIHQKDYINKLLNKFGLSECNATKLPAQVNYKLQNREESESSFNITDYKSAIGSLLYLAGMTRPDISFAVNYAARFQSDPGTSHWAYVKQIFRYLKGTVNLGLMYERKKSINLTAYSDSDWAGDTVDRKSTSGYLFVVNNTPVAWSSTKQRTIALSSTESEIIGIVNAVKECIWLRALFEDFQCTFKKATIIYGDNMSANQIIKNNINNERSKHISIRYSFIKDLIDQNVFKIEKIESKRNLSDILTKALPYASIESFKQNINLRIVKERVDP